METTRLLDSYRLALARDRKAIRLLSILQRDGAQTDEVLAGATGLPLHELRIKLTELFRANFVQTLPNDLYATTEMAEHILAALGVTDAIGSDAVASSKLPEQDKRFLIAYFANRDAEPTEWRRYLAAAAKIAQHLEQTGSLSRETSTRLWYASLAGLDPATHELGSETACRRVFKHVDLKAGNVIVEFKHFEQSCETARTDRFRSNEFVATGKHSSSTTDKEITLALTLTRLLASALARHSDDGLMAAFSDDGISEKARTALNDWVSSFEEQYSSVFDKYLHRAHRQTTLVDDLCENLAMAPISRHLSGTDGSKAASQSTIVGALKAIEAELRAGKVSLRERREALTLVGRVHELLLTSTRTKPIS